jgi:hypothetical protein
MGHPDIHWLSIQPKVDVALPEDWFAAACARGNAQIDYGADGILYLPFDLTVGRKLFENFVASLEYSRSLFHDKGFEPYLW